MAQAVSGSAAPYLAEIIHQQTITNGPDGKEVVNVEANLIAHAVVGAVTAYAAGNPALAVHPARRWASSLRSRCIRELSAKT